MREKWRELYTEQQLKQLQEIEYEMLCVFDDICEKMGLTYVLYGGTLLGAYKYQGFIPWDDDVDVAMPRQDYEVFISKAQDFLPQKYIVQTPHNEKKTPFSYCKLRLKGTKYIEKFHHKLDIEQGIYMDVYPIDDIPDDEEMRKKQFRRIQRLFKMYYYRQCLHVDKTMSMTSKIKQIFAYFVLNLIPHQRLVKKIEKIQTMYNEKGYVRKNCMNSPNFENIYEEFYPFRKVLFNGKEFNAPQDIKGHLIRRYGNIEELPPENERIGHRPYIFELNC